MRTLFVLVAALALTTANAQETTSLIRGRVSISITKGTIACDFILSNLPKIENYVIRLNSGMNIHYFKDVKRGGGPLYYDMDTKDSIGSDETKAYYVHENRGNPARYLPEELEVKYLGMYPVITDSASGYMGQDWRGNIAFNGYSIRAEGFQGGWYPEIYDMDKKKRYSEVKYDINVSCDDCTVLFVSGSSPQKATQAEFKNDIPCEMSMFCGKFPVSENRGIWLLNSNMPKPDEDRFFSTAIRYQQYYEKLFDIPFKGSLSFVQTTPVADTTSWAFAFYSAPTTFNVGAGQWGLQALFKGNGARKHMQGMAHELAHYYFGTLLKGEGTFGSIISEGFAEYLSYQLTRSLEGDSAYRGLLKDKVESLKYFKDYQPLSLVRTEGDYGNREYYLYYYAPILFMAIHQEIGDQAMSKWLRTMVNSKADVADYPFLVTTFEASVPDKALAEKIKSKYFTSPDALKSAIDELLGMN